MTSDEPRFTEEELREVERLQSDPTSEYYYNDPDESFMSKLKRKLEPYGDEFKGFIEYLFTPSRHFGTGQYSKGGLETQTENAFGKAISKRPGFRSFSEAKGQVSAEELKEGVDNAATYLLPFYDAGINMSNVIEEYMKPESERDYDYIKQQFNEAGQSAAIEAGMILLGGVVFKYGGQGIKALYDKAKQYEVDPNAVSAFGVGTLRKKDTFEEVMTPVKSTRKGVTKSGDAVLRPSVDLASDLDPRLKRAMAADTAGSIMPSPGKFFDPSKKGYKGDRFVGMLKDADIELDLEFGNYIMMGKNPKDVSNETFENLFISARPSEKKTTFGKNNKSIARANLYDGPSLSIADMKANYKAATGKTGSEVRTNLLQPERFKIVADEGDRLLDHPIVAVETKGKDGKHFYTLDTQFVGPVRMDRLTQKAKRKNPRTGEVREEVPQPNLRPATVGDVKLGEQVGTIRVGKKEHPLYDYIEVDASKSAPEDMGSIPKFNEGGVAMNEQMEMAFMKQGGIKDDGMKKDPVSGNPIPPGSMATEVRDDIPAMLSEGEYVVPADVLRYYGVNFFENLRGQAKQGLQSMEANGRIGGEPMSPQQVQQNMSGQPMAGAPAVQPIAANAGIMTTQQPDLSSYLQQAQQLGGQPFNTANYTTVGGTLFEPEKPKSITLTKTFVNAENPSDKRVVTFVDGAVQPSSDKQYTQPPYYEQGTTGLADAISAFEVSQNTGGGGGDPKDPPEPKDPWGTSIDFSDPLAYAQQLADPSTAQKFLKAGTLGAAMIGGPFGMAMAGVGSTALGLQQVSELEATKILAEAQGIDTTEIDKILEKVRASQNLAGQTLDDILATGKGKAHGYIKRLGLRGTRDPKTGKYTYSATDKAYNKARILADNDETAAITSGPGGTSDDGGPGVTVTQGGGTTPTGGGETGDKYTFSDEGLTAEQIAEEEAINDAIFDAIDADIEEQLGGNKGGLMSKGKKKK
tara:strand:+ start:281 stop:3199 length:2919 start_codon:yes stop_codon:yes gene_type:complete